MPRPAETESPRWGAPIVCILTFVAYASTFGFQFVHDDRSQILGNPAIQSWGAITSYFTAQVWSAIAPTALGNDYRPLFLLWLRINDALFGAHAASWHFTTVLVHVAATYWVLRLARRIFANESIALVTGLIFGLHPVHSEAVAWISGVPEPLLAALLIPSYLCWVRAREINVPKERRRWMACSLGLFALALLTKETAVVLLPILLVSQWIGFPRPLEASRGTWVRRLWNALKGLTPYGLLLMLYLAMRTLALKGFSHPAAHIGWGTVVLTWPSLLLFYLKLLLWPVGLSPFYGLQYVAHPTGRNFMLPCLVLLLVGALAVVWMRRSRLAALAMAWLVLPVLPVLNIQIFGNGNFAHNRYLYLPSVGFCMLVALALSPLRYGPMVGGVPAALVGVGAALALVFGIAIQTEDSYYANDFAFYSYAFSHGENNEPVIAMDYANTLAEQGDYAQAEGMYRKLIEMHPDMWRAYFNLGYMCYQQGDLTCAEEDLTKSAHGDPEDAGAFFYLGIVDLKLRRLDEAAANLRRAIAINPSAPNYHFALGVVLRVKGDWRGALAEFHRELELHPDHTAAAQQAEEVQKLLFGK